MDSYHLGDIVKVYLKNIILLNNYTIKGFAIWFEVTLFSSTFLALLTRIFMSPYDCRMSTDDSCAILVEFHRFHVPRYCIQTLYACQINTRFVLLNYIKCVILVVIGSISLCIHHQRAFLDLKKSQFSDLVTK